MMTAEKILKIVLRENRAISTGWRMDWSEFDGRRLLFQTDRLAAWVEEALKRGAEYEFTEGTRFLKEQQEPR